MSLLKQFLLLCLCFLPVAVHAADPDDLPMVQSGPTLIPDDQGELKAARPETLSTPVPQGAEIAPPAPDMSIAASEAEGDLLCDKAPAGTVADVPSPFSQWVVLVCSPLGQALVPPKGTKWVAHGTLDPISILAQPPSVSPMPETDQFDPRYEIRFKSLLGLETDGERRKRALAMLALASGADPVPVIDAIWQLDAVSNIGDTRYNVFFYVAKDRPQLIVACLEQCQQALLLDVMPSKQKAPLAQGD